MCRPTRKPSLANATSPTPSSHLLRQHRRQPNHLCPLLLGPSPHPLPSAVGRTYLASASFASRTGSSLLPHRDKQRPPLSKVQAPRRPEHRKAILSSSVRARGRSRMRKREKADLSPKSRGSVHLCCRRPGISETDCGSLIPDLLHQLRRYGDLPDRSSRVPERPRQQAAACLLVWIALDKVRPSLPPSR